MTIASEIQRIQGNIADAYNSCATKGATMPATNNSASLANTIDSISAGGGGELGLLGIGKYYVNNGVAMPQAGDVSDAFKGIISVADNGMFNACRQLNIVGVANFANCVSVSNHGLDSCFYSTRINEIAFPALTTSNSYGFSSAFCYCGNLISVNMHLLQNAGYQTFDHAFMSCGNLTTANFHSLTNCAPYAEAFNYAFMGCGNLTSVDFSSVSNIGASLVFSYCFQSCTNLKDIYFPSLTNNSFGSYTSQFNYMLSGVSGCNVHFSAAIQETIGSWASVTSGFGGTGTTVLFDL